MFVPIVCDVRIHWHKDWLLCLCQLSGKLESMDIRTCCCLYQLFEPMEIGNGCMNVSDVRKLVLIVEEIIVCTFVLIIAHSFQSSAFLRKSAIFVLPGNFCT